VSPAVRHCPGGQLPAEVASRWAGAGLAELTHAPTGYSDLGIVLLELPPGAAGTAHHHGPGESLLVVLSGEVVVEWGDGLRDAIQARAGDALAIEARAIHRERNPHSGLPVRYAVYLGSGGTFPVPG
jgi:uncharacterized RmlC-like cupin family protein